MSEKGPKRRFSAPDKLENHTNEGKGNFFKEKKKERRGRKEKKKAKVALLVFMMATV